MDKTQFQTTVASIESQAERIIKQVDGADKSIADGARQFDPALADLLDQGTTERRIISIKILAHIRARREGVKA